MEEGVGKKFWVEEQLIEKERLKECDNLLKAIW